MLAGALAGSATVLCTNPIWVVNTRMTARKAEASSTSTTSASDLEKGVQTGQVPKAKRPSTIGTLLAMINNEGIASLFAGVLPALVLVANPILQVCHVLIPFTLPCKLLTHVNFAVHHLRTTEEHPRASP